MGDKAFRTGLIRGWARANMTFGVLATLVGCFTRNVAMITMFGIAALVGVTVFVANEPEWKKIHDGN